MTALEQAVAEALDGVLPDDERSLRADLCERVAQVAVSALLSALTEEGPIREAAVDALALKMRGRWSDHREHRHDEWIDWQGRAAPSLDAALSAAATVKESKE